MRRGSQFWILNTAGWFAFLLLNGLLFAYFSGQLIQHTLIIQLVAFAFYLPATGVLRQIIHRLGWYQRRRHGWLVLKLLIITFIIALTGQFIVSLVMMYAMGVMNWSSYSIPVLLMTTIQNWIVLCLWTLIYLMIKQFRINRQQQIRQLQMERSVKEAELMALKAQLNPHFIFNCLNNIRALALDDGATTRQMITHLSEILKYSFHYDQQSQVTVKREVQHVNNYLALEAIHFEDRLNVRIEVESNVQQAQIPPFAVQLLVENAIIHGISKIPGGGELSIKIDSKDNQLRINVGNHGKYQPNDKNSGIGLNNLKQRLKLIYENRAKLIIQQSKDNWVEASITLPLETVEND